MTRLVDVRIDDADVLLSDVATIEIVEHPIRLVRRNARRIE